MATITESEAAELFRADPQDHLEVESGEVAYRSVGSGPDVLFIHGWPVNSATFRRLLPHLAEHVTCHLVDLPGAGSSRWQASDDLSIANHIRSVRRTVDVLGLEEVAVVGHDSGGMIARHAMAGDPRLRAMGLINTEQPQGLSWRFKTFLNARNVPRFADILGWAAGNRTVRKNPFVLGDAFADSSLLDGEFDEFFLRPLKSDPELRAATGSLLKSFEIRYIDELGALHQEIDVPVQLVWGDQDPFFPLEWAREMVDTFADADLRILTGAGLFSHEEQPEAAARALLPTLLGDR
ncbi:MAG: alpha/beta fold hydrolase [Microthrixaceae bacterium]